MDHLNSELPGSGIAEVQMQLYNVKQDSYHTHTVCLNEDLPQVHVHKNGVSKIRSALKSEYY